MAVAGTIDQRYIQLCGSRWDEVTHQLSDEFSKTESQKMLGAIWMITQDNLHLKWGTLVKQQANPFGNAQQGGEWKKDFAKLGSEPKKVLRQTLRSAIDDTNLGVLIDIDALVASLVEQKHIVDDRQGGQFTGQKVVREYIKDVAKCLCEMLLETNEFELRRPSVGQIWGENCKEFAEPLKESNVKASSACIKYYSRLTLYKGDKVVVKGTVLVDGWGERRK